MRGESRGNATVRVWTTVDESRFQAYQATLQIAGSLTQE